MSPKLESESALTRKLDLVLCIQSKLLLLAVRHTKFEVSRFSRSKIGARILKILTSSAIFDSTLSEF